MRQLIATTHHRSSVWPAQAGFIRLLLGLLIGLCTLSVARADDLLDQSIRHVFVPLEEFDAVMARDKQGVLLKRQEFEALLADALQKKSAPMQPSGLVVSSSRYVGRIDGEQLRLTATIQFTNFEPGWTEIQVPTDGLSVERCLINDKPALAGWHGENPNLLRVFTAQAGAGTLTLELTSRLAAIGSDLSTAFGLVPAASGELLITLPAGKFLLESGNNLPRNAAPDQPAEYRVALGGHRSTNLQITSRQAAARTDSLTLASTAISVTVAPGEVAWSAQSALQVIGRPLDKLVCTIPQSLEITSIESTGLDSWQLADTPNDPTRTTITLAYRQPFDGSRSITFQGVLKAATDVAWEVPTLDFNELSSQVGIATVRYPPGVRLRIGELDGVRTIVQQSEMTTNDDSRLYFQIWKPRFRLPFVTEPKTREVRAAVSNLLDLNATALDFTSVINLQTRQAPLFDAEINLPASWQIRSVFVGNDPVPWQIIPQEAGVNQVRVTFPTPIPPEGTAALTINAGLEPEGWPVEDQPVQVGLPRLQLPQAAIVEGLYGITSEEALEVVPSDLVGLDSPSQSESQLLAQKVANYGRTIRLGFSLQDTAYRGVLNVTRKPARVSSLASTFFRIDAETLSSHIESQLTIEGGGARRLLIDLPESAGTDLRFTLSSVMAMEPQPGQARQSYLLPGLKIVEQTAGAVEAGRRRWTLRLDRYATGTHLLAVDVRAAKSGPGPFACPVLSVVGAERETGFVAVEASQEQFLTPQAIDPSGQPLTKVDPIDFPSAFYQPNEPIVSGFRYSRPGWALLVGEQRFDRAGVPTAIGHDLQLQTVLGRNGELQHQADLTFTAIGIQNLKVRLPEGVDLWAVQMNGQPQAIRRQGEGLLVAVPTDGQANSRHQLTLFYRARLAGAVGSELQQQPPAFTVLDGQGTEQPLELLSQEWKLVHPDDWLVIDSPGAFQPTVDPDRDGWLARVSSLFRAPSPKRVRDGVLTLSILFLIAWGVRQTLERFGWGRSFAGFVGLGMIVLVGWSLTAVNFSMKGGAEDRYDVAATSAPAAATSEYFAKPQAAEDFDDLMARNGTDMPMTEPGMPMSGEAKYNQTWDGPVDATMSLRGRRDEALDGRIQEKAKNITRGGELDEEQVSSGKYQKPGEGKPTDPGKPGRAAGNGLVNRQKEDTLDEDAVRLHLTEEATSALAADKLFAPAPEAEAPAAAPEAPPAPAVMEPSFGLAVDTKQRMDFSENTPQRAIAAGFVPNSPGGLLSLALHLVTPPDSTQREFTFHGRSDTAPELGVQFTSRDRSQSMTVLTLVLTLIAGWFTRGQSLVRRVGGLVLLIVGSMAIAPLLPTRCQPIIDGLFFGGCAVLVLSLLSGIARWGCSRCCRTTVPAAPVAAALFLLAGLFAGESRAEEAAKQAPIEKPTPYVVLPYNTGDDPSTADRVFLPQPLFLKLWQAAHPEEATPPSAPLDGLIVEALHAATFEDAGKESVVHFKSRMVVMTLPNKQVSLALPIREVALKNAVLDGKPASLLADAGGYRLVVDQPGTHVLDVEFDLPAPLEGPAGRFILKTHPTAAAKLSVQLPKIMGDRDLRVNGSTGLYRLTENGEGPVLETAVDRGGEITISWQPRAVRGAGNTIVHVDTGAALIVDDVGFQLNHQFAYRVRQGSLNEVTLDVPAALSIRELSGPDVGGWQLDEAQGATRRLRVFLRRTVEDQTAIVLDLFTPLAVNAETQTLPVPEVVPMDATREIGQIGLFATSEFALRPVDVQGATRIDLDKYQPTAVPHRPEGLPLAAYRFATRPARVTISMARKQPETRCLAEHGVLVAPRRTEWASRFVFELTGAPRPSVSIDLPPDYLLMDVSGAEFINDWYDAPSENGHRTLTVEFDQPRLGQVELLLTGQAPRKPEAVGVDLLPPQALAIEKLNASFAVWMSDLYSATIRSAEGWKATPPEQLSGELRQLRSVPVQFAFRANAAVTAPVAIDLTRQVAQLSGDQVTLVAVADDSIDYGLTFRWKITRAAADTFRFTTPAWFKSRLELNVPGVRRISTDSTDSGDLLWTIELIDPVRGQFLCTGVVTLPPATDDLISLPNITFLEPGAAAMPAPLESQRRAAIVVNRSLGQLVAVDERLVQKIPREQLPLIIESGLLDQALAITELSPSIPYPQWKLVRSQAQEAGRATVIGSDLETSLDWDGTWRTQAVYTVRNRGQQFLGLELPSGARLMSVFVKGRASRTVTTQLQERMIHLVPLPQTSMVDLSFAVQVTVTGQLAAPLRSGWGLSSQEITLPAPQVVSREDSPDFGLTVAHTSWKVHTPDKLDVTLVRDHSRSNVDLLSGDDSFVSPEVSRLERVESDYQEMVRVLRNFEGDAARQMQCVSNLKQLGLSLNEYQNDSKLNETYSRNEELQTFNKRLQTQIATTIFNCPTPQSDQQVLTESLAKDNRDYILNQNSANFINNGIAIDQNGESLPNEEAKLEFKEREVVVGKKSDRATKSENGRGALRRQLESQSYSNAGQGLQRKSLEDSKGVSQFGDGLSFQNNGGLVPAQKPQQAQQLNQVQLFDVSGTVRFGTVTGGGGMGGGFGFAPGEHGQSGSDGTTMLGRTTATAAGWTQPGGLSLPIAFPRVGTQTVFSKVGGDPQLTMSLRPRQAWTSALTWLWSIGWGLLGLWIIRRVQRAMKGESFRPVLAILAGLGAIGSLLLPSPLSLVALIVFTVSLLTFMVTQLRREVTAP